MTQRIRFRVYGVIFLLVVALLLALTVALYQKRFTPVVTVKLRSDRAGLQLLPRSDVKVRGLIVGEVRSTRVTPTGAELDLAIDKNKASLIPDNVSARLLPKTLFGEKYVDLVLPQQRGPAIHTGTVIAQDRSRAAIEIDKVLDDVLPVLQAVRPEQLNATLNALATALQGRGGQIGRDIDQLDVLLRKYNPKLPVIVHDINALADVSDVYNAAAPDLLRVFRNLSVTNKTITDKQKTIEQLIPTVTGFANQGTQFVDENAPKLIGVNIANRQALELLATYSPEFPCVFKGLVTLKPKVEAAVGGQGPVLNITLEIIKPRPPYKNPLDRPELKDFRKPRCYGLPNPKVPFPEYTALDGTEDDKWWVGRGMSGVFVRPGMSDEESVKNVIGPMTRTPADQVSGASVLLWDPLFQGSVVTVG
ncbi:MAG TPA: MCE family protein [Streptosporangiaceae bacterium]|jgi:phospholipid/cholesterol/gamma-HCH transport system substrate-binding protein